MTGVYLIHFDPPYKHARHYLGWARNIDKRVAHHLAGRGARLTQVAADVGIQMEMVRVWPDADRTFERELKNRKNTPKLCPRCTEPKPAV